MCCTHTSLSGLRNPDSVMILIEMHSALLGWDVSESRNGYS